MSWLYYSICVYIMRQDETQIALDVHPSESRLLKKFLLLIEKITGLKNNKHQ